MADDNDRRDENSSHRFTDREIALLLQRASEIESRRSDAPPAQGMSLRQLREIALEVGISPEVFEEAVTAVQAGATPPRRELLGAPLSNKTARGVDGQLDAAGMARLLRVLEEAVDTTGTVTEALGTVRWTSLRADQFEPTVQVSMVARKDETQVIVVQRYPPAARILMHILPTVWGGALFGAIAAGMHAPEALIAIGGISFAVLGGLFGHGLWQRTARRSEEKIQRIAGTLAAAARDMREAGGG